jgi:6-pyruvoyltetrahydropterin/6-carboxytetrahydropterin synthase
MPEPRKTPEGPAVAVTRRFTFSAAHRYTRPEWSDAENRARFGPLASIHGHTYTLEVTVRGPVDPRTGMVVDLEELKQVVGETVITRFDHAFVNDDSAFPPGTLPTTENLVRVMWGLLIAKLGAERLAHLRLWEDPTLYVDYRGEA